MLGYITCIYLKVDSRLIIYLPNNCNDKDCKKFFKIQICFLLIYNKNELSGLKLLKPLNLIFFLFQLPVYHMRKDRVAASLRESLNNLRIDYIDLYLIHVPAAIKVCVHVLLNGIFISYK